MLLLDISLLLHRRCELTYQKLKILFRERATHRGPVQRFCSRDVHCTHLCSCRQTWFSGHTIEWYHCSLFRHYRLHSPFLHHSARDQECSFHQGGTEIHPQCSQQENQLLNFKWIRGKWDKIGMKLWFSCNF